ncbi:MAG: restriction endonuclease [Methylococcales bacterium]|nr:restriction endonuclease [Methylococcales bacterium]
MKILWIDDFPASTYYFREGLRDSGVNNYLAFSSLEAINFLEKSSPNAIISDCCRHENSIFSRANSLYAGLEFYHKYIKIKHPNIPVLFLSAMGAQHVMRGLEPDGCLILDKLISWDDFFKTLSAILSEDIDYIYKKQSCEKTDTKVILTIDTAFKRELLKNPRILHEISPRKFEELIAVIMSDLGFDVQLTRATRDGGADIYASLKNEATSFLTVIECKKWSQDRKVGIEVVQRMAGVQLSNHANKSLIVTTSFFSQPAIEQARQYKGMMELKDYNSLKTWLEIYQGHLIKK